MRKKDIGEDDLNNLANEGGTETYFHNPVWVGFLKDDEVDLSDISAIIEITLFGISIIAPYCTL